MAAHTHGLLYLYRLARGGEITYKERLMMEYQADYLPRYYLAQPSGSCDDVQAKERWHDNTQTIAVGRQLCALNDVELSFDIGDVYLFAVSCDEMAAASMEDNPHVTLLLQ